MSKLRGFLRGRESGLHAVGISLTEPRISFVSVAASTNGSIYRRSRSGSSRGHSVHVAGRALRQELYAFGVLGIGPTFPGDLEKVLLLCSNHDFVVVAPILVAVAVGACGVSSALLFVVDLFQLLLAFLLVVGVLNEVANALDGFGVARRCLYVLF